MKTTLLILLLALGCSIQPVRAYLAQQTIETYTGEKYSAGDCKALDIYEADDESVVDACEILE